MISGPPDHSKDILAKRGEELLESLDPGSSRWPLYWVLKLFLFMGTVGVTCVVLFQLFSFLLVNKVSVMENIQKGNSFRVWLGIKTTFLMEMYPPEELVWTAIRANQTVILKDLLKQFPSISMQDGRHLFEAISIGSTEAIDLLLARGASVTQIIPYSLTAIPQVDGYPLHLACLLGKAKVADALLRRGAPLDMKDSNGDTPLQLAVREKHDDVVKMLLAAGAKPVDE